MDRSTKATLWIATRRQWHIAGDPDIRPGEKNDQCEANPEGGRRWLTLDDPASLNAMTPELLGGLAAAIGEMTSDPACGRWC